MALDAFRGNDAEFAKLLAEKKKRDQDVAEHEKRLPELQAQWEKDVHADAALDRRRAARSRNPPAGPSSRTRPMVPSIASGANPSPDSYTVTAKTTLKEITGIRLEVLPDPSLPGQGPGRAPNGNFVLSEFKVRYAKLEGKDKPKEVKLIAPAGDVFAGSIPDRQRHRQQPGHRLGDRSAITARISLPCSRPRPSSASAKAPS